MILKQKIISKRLGNTWIRRKFLKRNYCGLCNSDLCLRPILVNPIPKASTRISLFKDVCCLCPRNTEFTVYLLHVAETT